MKLAKEMREFDFLLLFLVGRRQLNTHKWQKIQQVPAVFNGVRRQLKWTFGQTTNICWYVRVLVRAYEMILMIFVNKKIL